MTNNAGENGLAICNHCGKPISKARLEADVCLCEWKGVTSARATPKAVSQNDETLRQLLFEVCQLLDGWHNDGTAWTEWDESVRKRCSMMLASISPDLQKYYQSKEVQDWLNAPMGTPKAGEFIEIWKYNEVLKHNTQYVEKLDRLESELSKLKKAGEVDREKVIELIAEYVCDYVDIAIAEGASTSIAGPTDGDYDMAKSMLSAIEERYTLIPKDK